MADEYDQRGLMAVDASPPDVTMVSENNLCKPMSHLSFVKKRRRRRRRSPATAASQRIVRKYRKFTREFEYRRLKMIVPAVANKDGASKAEILEEAIKYIDCLHQRIVESIRENGIPNSLLQQRTVQSQTNGVLASMSNNAATSSTSSLVRSPPQMPPSEIIGLVQSSVQPEIESRLRARRRLDQAAVQSLMKISKVSRDE